MRDDALEIESEAGFGRHPQVATQRAREIVERPAGDDRVVAEDDKGGDDAEPAHQAPD